MSLRLGGDSAVASKALGSPMSSSFTFRTVLPRGQRWKEQSLLRNNEISKLVNDHMTSVLDREAKKEKEGQEKEEKGQGRAVIHERRKINEVTNICCELSLLPGDSFLTAVQGGETRMDSENCLS